MMMLECKSKSVYTIIW